MFSLPWGSARGRETQMRAMETNGTLFAIVDKNATGVAGVTWRLYRKAKSGRKEDRVEVTSHAALDLWNRPNRFYTQAAFVETQQQHHELTGEGWWVVARDPRSPIPLELWPVRPDRMTPLPSATDYLAGYVYTAPGGEQVPLGLDEVIFLRRPNPLDPYRGLGPVQAMLVDLDAARYSAEWNRNFFLNSAEPGGLIRFDRRLDDREFDELRMRWNEQHKGISAAHRVAILEEGQWVDRKFSQRDMQFAELRSVSREVIREAVGFPKPLLGSVDDVNRANADAAEVVFARWLIVPRCRRIRDALNYDLLPMFGATARDLEFDFDNPVPDDRELEAAELTARANAASALVSVGYEPEGVLSAVGLPAIAFTSPPAAPSPTAGQPAAARALPRPRARSPRLRIGMRAGDDLEDVRADYEQALASLTATWDGIEEQWIRTLEDQIADAVDEDDTAALADLTVPADEAAAALRRALASMASQAAGRLVQEAAVQGVHIAAPTLDSALTNRAPAAAALRASYGSDLVDVAAVTATLLASGLAASAAREALRVLRPGVSGRSIATAVGDALRSAKGWFRRDQLGGALHRAQNTGRLAAIAAGPPDPVVTATEVHDGNRCGPCSDIDGYEFPSLDEADAAYGTGGYIDCDGGIRCRGTVVATWPAGS
nr:phage portal protein [Streptomyces sp. TLI_235]